MLPSLMSATVVPPDDLFTVWLDGPARPSRVRGRPTTQTVGGVRFAFYGRISTEGYQDPVSSRRWQFEIAEFMTHGHGRVGVEFFDVGYSRSLSWHDRPAAAELLAEAARPDRRFDAVVIGEYERAFAGRQALQVIPYLHAQGVSVWLPEFGGPVDLDDPTHGALFLLLGHQSEREVLRARRRTTRAMRTQVREQGRHLGGRPPYGYRLVDAGPHPNRIHARWGRRLHRLDPDPVTAPHVRWIFARRLAGDSAAGIARALNKRNVPSPSAYDPDRNRHRSGTEWTLRTVAEILANPRYTGRQVWNRQRTDRHETYPGDKSTSLGVSRVWNPRSEWVISERPAHPALVSEADFLAVQQVTAIPAPKDQGARTYLLTGLVICAMCGRRMDAHWVHGRPGYRCRHGYTSARSGGSRPKNVYWAEQRIIDGLLYQLSYAGELPFLADSRDLLDHLRTRRLVIVCGADTLDVEPVDLGKQVTPTTIITRMDDSGGG